MSEMLVGGGKRKAACQCVPSEKHQLFKHTKQIEKNDIRMEIQGFSKHLMQTKMTEILFGESFDLIIKGKFGAYLKLVCIFGDINPLYPFSIFPQRCWPKINTNLICIDCRKLFSF